MDMTWKNIRLIMLREVRDQLRDRRTLFMVLVLPVLLYPGLGIGMLEMTMLFKEQPRQVVILGADQLPEPTLVEDGRFPDRWFRDAENAKKLNVLTDLPGDRGSTSSLDSEGRLELLEVADRISQAVAKRNLLVPQLAPWDPRLADELPPVQAARMHERFASGEIPAAPDDILEKQTEFNLLVDEIGAEFSAGKMDVLVIVPNGFADNLQKVNELLAAGPDFRAELEALPLLRPVIVRNRADQKSDVAYHRTREAIDKWEKQLLKDRLDVAGLPETVPDPVSLLSINTASQEEIAASVWSRMFPALLVIMALTGAFYPAVDVAAGEKERGTMETLLICPATRTEIVMGKFMTVMLFSVATTMLNLLSMGFTGQYIVSATAGATGPMPMADVALPTPMALFWLVVLLVPLAAFFSAVSLALATFARSNKEGQYYLTPLFMVTIGMTMFSMSPSVELSAEGGASLFYSAMPIVGPSLLLKALLSNPGDTSVLVFALPVLMSSVGYSLIALYWAVEQFKSEDVLFREAERFDLKLWLKHLLRDKEPTPTSSEAAACFILMMFLQFLSLKLLGGAFNNVAPEDFGIRVMQIAVVSQVALMAAPAILMAILLTAKPRLTLKLKLPSLRMFGMALILPIVLHPLAVELLESLTQFFPDLPDSAQAAFATMADQKLPLWAVLGTFALTPAICEELAFRGFILTGFGRGGRVASAVVLSSVMFGIIHMVPQQVFNATLLGLVLGLLAIRSGSLIPGVIFHFCFNSLAVFYSKATFAWQTSRPEWLDSGPTSWFILFQDDKLRYNFLTLLICAAAAFILIRELARPQKKQQPKAESAVGPALTPTPAS